MDNPLITVVLPVYNVEKYLQRSVDSVLLQTYTNLEILLIDDGSPDNCPALCDGYAAGDQRIRVIHKQNAGLGMARNTGIDHATGKYICFLDSDDYIAPNTVEKCVKCITETNADVVQYGYYNVNRAGQIVRTNIPNPEKRIYEGAEIQKTFLPDLMYDDPKATHRNNLWMSMCGAMFRLETIQQNNWRLVSERQIIAEDVFSLTRFYSYARKVAILPEAFYYYCENGTSLTRTYRPDRFAGIKHFYTESLRQIDNLGYGKAMKDRLAMVTLSYTIAALKQEVAAPRSLKDNIAGVKAIVRDETTRQLLVDGINPLDSKGRQLLLQLMKRDLPLLCYILLRVKG